MIVFDIGVYLLEDLDFLGVGESVVVFAGHGSRLLVGVVLIPDLLDGIGSKFSVAADEGEVVVDGLGDEETIERIAMM